MTEGLVDYYSGPHTAQWHRAHAAAIDFTSPGVGAPFDDVMERLGVQHLMFEGGEVDALPYRAHVSAAYASPNQYVADYTAHASDAWSNVESAYRTQHVDHFLQLYDANSTQERRLNGLQSVLPQAFALGVMGYPWFVPSAVGGSRYDDESAPPPALSLYKRWVQLAAFMPVMHFSYLPPQLDQDTVNMINRYTDLHKVEVVPLLESIKHNVTSLLQPIVRPLWWYDPHDEVCVHTHDQFMVGDVFLVAPVLDETSTSRDVYLPAGRWYDENLFTTHDGPQWLLDYVATANTIPYFRRFDADNVA